MSKETRTFDLEEPLMDSAVRIIHTAQSLPKTKGQENLMIRNSLFDIRYSIHF